MTQTTSAREYRRRLVRSRRVWDLGARPYRLEGWMARQQHVQWRLAVDALGLRAGEVVLDLGCGGGGAFAALRQAVGEHGRVVGLDHSPRMLAKARSLVTGHGWDNVDVRPGDASATPVEPGAYDAAIASYSLSTVPDLGAAVGHLHAALRPGGRAFVGDVYFGPHPAAQLLRKLYRGLTAANAEDVAAALRARFDVVEPVVGDSGRRLVLPSGRSWPPIIYVLARKAPQ